MQRPIELVGKTYKIAVGADEKVYITINGYPDDPKRPFEVFLNSYSSNDSNYKALGTTLSALCRTSNDISFLIDDFERITSEQSIWWEGIRVRSLSHAIAMSLRAFMSGSEFVSRKSPAEKEKISELSTEKVPTLDAYDTILRDLEAGQLNGKKISEMTFDEVYTAKQNFEIFKRDLARQIAHAEASLEQKKFHAAKPIIAEAIKEAIFEAGKDDPNLDERLELLAKDHAELDEYIRAAWRHREDPGSIEVQRPLGVTDEEIAKRSLELASMESSKAIGIPSDAKAPAVVRLDNMETSLRAAEIIFDVPGQVPPALDATQTTSAGTAPEESSYEDIKQRLREADKLYYKTLPEIYEKTPDRIPLEHAPVDPSKDLDEPWRSAQAKQDGDLCPKCREMTIHRMGGCKACRNPECDYVGDCG